MAKEIVSIKSWKGNVENVKDDALVIGFFKDKVDFSNLKALDSTCANMLSSFVKKNEFKAEKGEAKSIFVDKDVKNVVLLGLGEQDKFSFEIACNVVADVVKRLRDSKIENITIFIDSLNNGKLDNNELFEKLSMSAVAGLYKFTDYKTKEKDKIKVVKQITFATKLGNNFDDAIRKGMIIGEAMCKTRDVIHTPPNVATPEYVADYAKKLAKENGLRYTVFDENKIQKMKMDCFWCVAKGSRLKPRFVILEYFGTSKSEKPLALVGKGITFDSGGLNLKPYPYILNMKDDKGGAVAAMHVIEVAAKLKLPVNLIVATPLCENMPGGNAYRPDDVYTAHNGITVEIKNTDAEGRMVLADALSYVSNLKPKAIIDIATLTGASLIAIGFYGTPFLSNDEKLTEKLMHASKKSMERLWELPLWPEFDDQIKSDIADLKHISEEGDAGVIIGGTFLKHFVAEGIPWAHIDIGTTVWTKSDKGFITKGATGATIRLLVELLKDWK